MTLADTSAWIEFLRQSGSPVHLRFRELARAGALVATEPVVMEVLAGVPRERARELRRALATVGMLHVGVLDAWESAAAIYRSCRAAGYTVRSQLDCLIAAVAIREDLPVLHADRDFDRIAACVPLRTDALSGFE